jgi:4-hydroxy-tetrahydrodipicolinate reductase
MYMGDVIRIGVSGALGRMGQVLQTLTKAREDMALAARIDRPGVEAGPADSNLLAPAEAMGLCDVIIDFSTAAASTELAALAAAAGGPALVIGATGFTPDQEAVIAAAAETIAIVKSGNFSLGVNMLALLVEEAARRLGPEAWDVEILEAHHRRKVDAPSGTALLLGDAAARGRGEAPEMARLPERSGLGGARPQGGIGYASLRGGGIVGEHSVIFAAEDEIITLAHSARDRSLFARGALVAAAWVVTAKPGLYGMTDVLGV